jgi:hypothetical protein
MSKMGSKLVWIAGGSALFAAAFVGVALARGASLHEVPPFSWLAAPAPAGEHAPGPAPAGTLASTPGPALPQSEHTGNEHAAHEPAARAPLGPIVPPMTAGVLGAFVMPSPFDARELRELDQRLKDGLARVAAEEARQKKHERELEDWQSLLQQRAQELAALRKSLDESGLPAAGDTAGSGKSAASWRTLAPLFEEGDASEVAERLGQLEPDQAAQVLRGLDADRVAALLNALPKDRYKVFLDAWRRAGG